MKNILFFYLLCMCLPMMSKSQQTDPSYKILQAIEQNNEVLKAQRAYRKQQEIEGQLLMRWTAPEVKAYYLPLGRHQTGAYTEFELSQNTALPAVYKSRKEYAATRQKQFAEEYQMTRRKILMEAKAYLLELSYLRAQYVRQEKRLELAKQLKLRAAETYQAQQISKLEWSRIQLSYLELQTEVAQTAASIQILEQHIESLNGDVDLGPLLAQVMVYVEVDRLPSLDSLWALQKAKDVRLKLADARTKVARSYVQLQKRNRLPIVSFGLNYQGFAEEYYWGLQLGASIPLWSAKNKVAAAEVGVEYAQASYLAKFQKAYATLKQTYTRVESLRQRWQAYQNNLVQLDAEVLLMEAYQLGELSYFNYYTELKFYKEAHARMLRIEFELQTAYAELFAFLI